MRHVQNRADDQQKIYQRWAPVYDQVYRSILRDGHRTLARLAADAGTDILEIGVGTGLVLSYYPRRSRVTGIDISEHMIAKAREKVARHKLFHVRQLQVMDAHALAFEDRSFDAVCLPFVITLIPEPERALDECARVLRPGGEIILASKLGDGAGLQGAIEEAVAPLVRRVGWSSSFRIRRITDWAKGNGFDEVQILPVFPNGFFKVMRLKRRASDA
ncbi:phosphatidylethanolamine/phosphatidyl-N-methylethanolamine N-methyltransferase [Rhizobium sp. BK529]|uniref:class I SAM-dependent methyltransferase n=1 Tax=unclassified Rhizobium TaxID=2613769 RepID=UPI00104FEA27|nr:MULTISPECIES: class I SAM-dependent methyltransferase [unclassified Rhizobium]MBB3592096.1 phosphatidylethanolamine/phosphatidyl-N-methylethanolamine N-methyltransferase [Rhizobium sp. BK529]TCS06518.1 phosphatidylethanolamine/phosphatidyl-N-methylethanolamine N-methyltransferase [Rhizobium sp. BK418]